MYKNSEIDKSHNNRVELYIQIDKLRLINYPSLWPAQIHPTFLRLDAKTTHYSGSAKNLSSVFNEPDESQTWRFRFPWDWVGTPVVSRLYDLNIWLSVNVGISVISLGLKLWFIEVCVCVLLREGVFVQVWGHRRAKI